MLDINVTRTDTPGAKPKKDQPLGFGQIFTDHMFRMAYSEGQGWHDPRIIPFQALSLSPAAMVLHYGQSIFEGMKAYRAPDGRALLFRPEMNAKRSNQSCQRLCIPTIPEDDFIQAIRAVVKTDEGWIPESPGSTLYIRPFVIATEARLGVAASKNYLFLIILSPSGTYYPDGMAPIGIRIEDEYVRAIRGGMGHIKASGNYAVSLIGQVKAHEQGYSQVLWLDGVERRYIEEVGSMNIFMKIDGHILTPRLNGSILPGVTRDSILTLCREWGLPVEERRISVDELTAACREGRVEEMFGTGTAAVVTPVGKLRYQDEVMPVGDGGIGPLSQRLYDELTGIQWGRLPDRHQWTMEV
jgi:branched-chain amino acid aminotransferase